MKAGHILCVEDEVDLLSDLVDELEDAGYCVVACSDGQEAVQALTDTAFDLVLCDIQLPGITGLDVLRLARETQGGQLLPFILMTAYGDSVIRSHADCFAGVDILIKPIDYRSLLNTISEQLRIHGPGSD